MKNSRRFVAGMSCLAMTLCIITGCTKHQTIDDGGYTYDEALKELNAFNSELTADEIPATLDHLQHQNSVGYSCGH